VLRINGRCRLVCERVNEVDEPLEICGGTSMGKRRRRTVNGFLSHGCDYLLKGGETRAREVEVDVVQDVNSRYRATKQRCTTEAACPYLPRS
jgi:hypothetical protein